MLTSLSLAGTDIIVYRDDLNNAAVSGNKLHKLTPNIKLAKDRGCSSVLSFGGPYSNHLHALAWACKNAGLASIGVVRGELHATLTPTLKDCQRWGMKLVSSPRKDYRAFQEALLLDDEPCLASNFSLIRSLEPLEPLELENTLVIPEGGSNVAAIESLCEAYQTVFKLADCENLTHAVCATGTGATLAGLYNAAPEHVKVIGVQAVAEGSATFDRVCSWLSAKKTDTSRLTIKEGHLGRFGKMPLELIDFIDRFEAQYDIPLDPVYTGKVMLKVSQMIEAGYFKATDKVLFIHTGGLQGKRV